MPKKFRLDDIMSTLGERLKFLRESLKLTATEVKEQLEINDLGRFEKGERKPSIDTLLIISNFYKVSTDWLLTGRNIDNIVLSDLEKELLESYKMLGNDNKLRILEQTKTLLEIEKSLRFAQIKPM